MAATPEIKMDTLPDELLFEIINQLFLEDIQDVWNISLTNRRLHRIAKELLYSSYSLDRNDPGLFIRALASSPNLERCVQRVTWASKDYAFKFPEVLTAVELGYITKRVGFGKVGEREIAGEKKIRKLNAWLADRGKEEHINTFMLFTPKVKKVVILVPLTWDLKAVWFKPALDSQIFSNLQQANINGEIRVGNVLALFLLPSMRTLALSHLSINRNSHGMGSLREWEADNALWKRLQREGSSLENLILPAVGTDTLDLTRVLESFRGLKKFKIAFRGHGLGKDDVNVRTLLHAIAHHHGSLTSLNIDDHRLEEDPDALEELSVLEHLECLQMLTPVFYGGSRFDSTQEVLAESLPKRFKNLPRHLKHLRISAIEDHYDLSEPLLDVLLRMAPTIDTLLPDLEKITIFGWHPQLGIFPCQTRLAALQSAFEKAGVELVSIHDMDGPADRWYEESRVTISTSIEEGWVWVQLLGDYYDDNYEDDDNEDDDNEERYESQTPWPREFGKWWDGNELERDDFDT
jgi:hypothetical protein